MTEEWVWSDDPWSLYQDDRCACSRDGASGRQGCVCSYPLGPMLQEDGESYEEYLQRYYAQYGSSRVETQRDDETYEEYLARYYAQVRGAQSRQAGDSATSGHTGHTQARPDYSAFAEDARGSSYDNNPEIAAFYANGGNPGLHYVYGAIQNAHDNLPALNDEDSLDACDSHSPLARHEARHCVLAESEAANGGRCNGVSIEGRGGSDSTAGGSRNPRGEAMHWLAGGSRNACGAAGDFSPEDWATGIQYARQAGMSAQEAIQATQERLGQPINARAVDMMAAALDQQKTLNRDQVLSICRRAGMDL